MKNSCTNLGISVLFFLLTVILQSCGNENMVTQPNEKNTNDAPLKKATPIAALKIDNISDTLITLLKSKKTILISKNVPPNEIEQIDEFLSNASISSSMSKIQPLTSYTQHTTSWWELENQYTPVSDKYLGIWTDKINWTKCHDQYGFRYIITSFADASNAVNSHFDRNNIMINLPFDISQNDINDNGNEAYNYYYIDEPFYRQLINQNFLNIASWVYQKNPTALFIMSDFYWPEFDLLCYGHEGNGNTVKTYWFPNPNVRIMCDQYDGNGCGDVHSFWDEYKAFYGIPNRNLTNWITLEPGHSPDWGDLLNVAMAWSQWGAMNPIWIYAGDNNVTESTLEYFCETAWETHWLYRYRKHVIVTYQCSGPNCVWGLGGEWSIYRMRYDGQEGYVGY